MYYVRKSSHSTDLSKYCLLTYGNKVIPVAPHWPSEAGWHLCVAATCSGRPGQLRSPSCVQSQMNNNSKTRKLVSERGCSVLKCMARQLWRGITFIKRRCLQPGGSREPRTQTSRGQAVCPYLSACLKESGQEHPTKKQTDTNFLSS